jgi:hypothetical protein
MKKSVETILSISAIVIALASICITFWESSIMREHYHLSVKPKIDYSYVFNGTNAGFILKNRGLGPAIVVSKDYYIDGEKIDESQNHFSILILEALNINSPTSFNSINKGGVIEVGEEINLFTLNFKDEDTFFQKRFELNDRFTFKIIYESFYGEKFEVHNIKEKK